MQTADRKRRGAGYSRRRRTGRGIKIAVRIFKIRRVKRYATPSSRTIT
jgi:hypothetical protein